MPRPRKPAVAVPVDEKVLGERIRELRKRQGMSQAELAAELGLNQTAVSDYETGAARIHAAMLAALARVLRTSADELLGLSSARIARGTGPAPDRRFLRRLERLDRLSRRDQQALLNTIRRLPRQSLVSRPRALIGGSWTGTADHRPANFRRILWFLARNLGSPAAPDPG
jgi:transcriptional regulator with XRE-family HTH domain